MVRHGRREPGASQSCLACTAGQLCWHNTACLSVKLLVSVNWRAALALAASWRAPCPGWGPQAQPMSVGQPVHTITGVQGLPTDRQAGVRYPVQAAPTSMTMSVRAPLLGITVVSRLSGAPSKAATASAS